MELPLSATKREEELLSPRRLAQTTWALLILGILARTIRYLLRFPLWQDEAFLAVNFLDRDFSGLMGPLENHQVAPLLFLWLQLAIVRLLGFSEYTLRLFPFLSGVASLLLFRHLAGRILRGIALTMAVGFFASAYVLIRYTCDAKPYSSDVLVSLVLLSLAVAWWRSRRQVWLWALAATVPWAVGLSYPAVFLGGGLSVAIGHQILRGNRGEAAAPVASDQSEKADRRRGWPAWTVYNLALVGSFAGFYTLVTTNQVQSELGWMREYWRDIFPPLHTPAKLVAWLVETHASDLVSYPIGGAHYGSTLTLICCVAALAVLFRRGHGGLVLLCLAPMGLNFVAAALQRYPYGASPRFTLYLAPIVCLLGGLGAAWLILPKARDRKRQPVALAVVLCLMAAIPLGSILRDFLRPYRTQEVLRERDFARWFWFQKQFEGDVVCLETDLFPAPVALEGRTAAAALYLCNRQIYGPQRRDTRLVEDNPVPADRPLCCVRFVPGGATRTSAAFSRWLEGMQAGYVLADRRRYSFPTFYKDRDLLGVHYLEVYEFLPRTADNAAKVHLHDGRFTELQCCRQPP